jgi:hypothetical protein
MQLTPPEGAVLGERVRFGDLEAAQRDADTPNRCASLLRRFPRCTQGVVARAACELNKSHLGTMLPSAATCPITHSTPLRDNTHRDGAWVGESHRVQKKKVWEAVQPELNTSADCVVQYKDKAMLTSAGPVTVASLTGATVG